MNIVYRDIKDLISAEYNPRQLTNEQFIQISDSIKRFGIVDPIIVNKNKDREDIIIGGHQRIKVAKDLNIEKVPTVELDLTYDKERELNIRLNKNSGEWDYDVLANGFEMDELMEWGFNEDELVGFAPDEEEVKGLTDDDDVPDDVEPVCKLGDLYQLGEHRLLCGDSTKKEDVEKLMDGKKADMVFTDPPYLMDFDGSVHSDGSKSYNSKYKKIKNDKMSRKDGDVFVNNIIKTIIDNTDGSFYICFYRLGLDYIYRALDYYNKKCRALIIWNKGNHTLSNSDYMSKYEPIIYGWNKKHNFYGKKGSFDIWNIDRTKKNDLHPTMKPVELSIIAINNSSLNKNIILDPFLGSGSTLIACEKTNRKCYGVELDPHYCDVIIKRWEDYTGQKAKLIG